MHKMVNGEEIQLTAEEEAATLEEWAANATEDAAAAAAAAVTQAKLDGVLFDGVMCSATAEDMWGLSAIQDQVAGGMDINFTFDNGSTIVLTSENMTAFKDVWVPFRASFFPLP